MQSSEPSSRDSLSSVPGVVWTSLLSVWKVQLTGGTPTVGTLPEVICSFSSPPVSWMRWGLISEEYLEHSSPLTCLRGYHRKHATKITITAGSQFEGWSLSIWFKTRNRIYEASSDGTFPYKWAMPSSSNLPLITSAFITSRQPEWILSSPARNKSLQSTKSGLFKYFAPANADSWAPPNN